MPRNAPKPDTTRNGRNPPAATKGFRGGPPERGRQVSSGDSTKSSSSKTSLQKGEAGEKSPSNSGRSAPGQVSGNNQSTSEQSKWKNAVKVLLERLKTQCDSNTYDEKVFTRQTGANNVDVENCIKILKEICINLKTRREEQSRLELQSIAVKKLCTKLEKACEEILKVKSNADSNQPMKVKGKALKQGPPADDISVAEANADKLIEKLRVKSDTSAVKSKQNDKRIQEAEDRGKAKVLVVNEWLLKLEKQIETDKYDVNDFKEQKSSVVSHEEVKKCHKTVNDICMKLKNKTDSMKSSNDELTHLANEIKAWDSVNEIKFKKSTQDDMTKSLRTCRLQVLERKKLFNISNDELTHLANEIKAWDSVNDIELKTGTQDDMTETVRTCRLQISEEKKQLISVREEIQNLEKEINVWNNVKEVGNSAKFPDGMLKTVRTCRLKLLEKKKEQSGKENNKDKVEIQRQEEKIKKLWKTLFPNKPKSESMAVDTILDELGKYISEITKIAEKDKLVKANMRKHAVDLWKMWSVSEDLPPENVIEILQTVTIEVNNVHEEIDNLEKEIYAWNTVKEIESSTKISDGISKTVRTCRLQLLGQKKELSENESKKGGLELKKQEEHIKKIWKTMLPEKPESESISADTALDEIQKYISEIKENAEKEKAVKEGIWEHVVGLWKMALGSEDFPQSGNRRNDGIKILERVTNEVQEIEKVTSKLEEACYEIHNNFLAKMPAKKGELGNSLQVLQNNLQILQACEKETGAFVKTFSELEICFVHEMTQGSLTDKCKAMLKSAKSSQKNVVKKEEHEKLKENYSALRQEINKMTTERDAALLRLSKVAGARLTENNPNIADLSDLNRPTKLAEHFSEVYDNQWTDAFESLTQLDEKKAISFLLQILLDTYKCCGEISVNHLNNLKKAVSNPVMNFGSTDAAKKKNDKDIALQAVQSKALSELRKQCVDISVTSVQAHFRKSYKNWFETNALEKYTLICIQLCWLMHAQTPPLVIISKIKPGSQFNTSMLRQYTKSGKQIDFLVWPVLLLEEDGAVLCKGVAQAK